MAETAANVPGNSTAKFNSAGTDVWTVVAMGDFESRPSTTKLPLDVVNPCGGDVLLSHLKPGNQLESAAFPALAVEDSIWINVPEPEAALMVGFNALTVAGGLPRLHSSRARS